MRRHVFILCALATLLLMTGPAFGALKREELKLTYAETWEGGIAEAKARAVPIIFIWPDRG